MRAGDAQRLTRKVCELAVSEGRTDRTRVGDHHSRSGSATPAPARSCAGRLRPLPCPSQAPANRRFFAYSTSAAVSGQGCRPSIDGRCRGRVGRRVARARLPADARVRSSTAAFRTVTQVTYMRVSMSGRPQTTTYVTHEQRLLQESSTEPFCIGRRPPNLSTKSTRKGDRPW